MTSRYTPEIQANLERAAQSIKASKDLFETASRAYYAAFYGATSVLLSKGLE